MRSLVEVAWTISARASGGPRTYASAVLHVECSWGTHRDSTRGPTQTWTAQTASLSARVLSGALVRPVSLAPSCTARVECRAPWTHIHLCCETTGDLLLNASFFQGRLMYATGLLPQRAGLQGATYDAPTGTLDELPTE